VCLRTASATISRVVNGGRPACPHRPCRTSARGMTGRSSAPASHHRGAHIDDRIQPRPQKVALSRLSSFLRSHRPLRCHDGITTPDSKGNAKTKLQAFGALSPKSLQSQMPTGPENRLSLKGLEDFSRPTMINNDRILSNAGASGLLSEVLSRLADD
jgi:hypothetical protein